ncbi:MAG: aminopeptidase [Candidatus Coprovivens sp.]
MKEKMIKYAQVLLNTCLKVDKDQPLFISGNIERIDFMRIVADEAYKIGIKDINVEIVDPILKHSALKNLTFEELKNTEYWNKAKWNEYAEIGGAFLMLASETPGLMEDIDSKKISDITMYGYETRKKFDELRDKQITPWCIAAVPTESWAKFVFPQSKNSVEELWNKIFEICGINEENPEEYLQNKIDKLKIRAKKLNDYKFKTLKYENSLGTNLEIGLPKKHVWASGGETLITGKEILVNFPTEEIFTSPDCTTANGIVYSSKPLSYQDVVINDFYIEFKDGVAINCGAKKGEETLKNILSSCENSNRLGEVALVPYDSPISNSNVIFYETLFDENAACHLALGASFPECILGGEKMSKEELNEYNLNECTNHVDFMIGTKDLKITGFTPENKEVIIFENGNFSKEFE